MLKNFIILSILFGACSHNPQKINTIKKKADLYYGHGTGYLVQKDYTSALKYLLKAVELTPKDSKVHNNLGMAYYFKKDHAKAIGHLKRAIELDLKNSDARNNIASLYMEKGDLQEAKRQYLLVLKDLIYPHQYRTYYNLALIDLQEKKRNEAYNKFEKSIQKNNQYCPAYYQLGLLSRQKLMFSKAVDFFKKASLGSCVNTPAPFYQQALTYADLNEHEKAFHKLREIIERFPDTQYSALATRKLKALKIDQFRNKTYRPSRILSSPNSKRSTTQKKDSDYSSVSF